MSDTLRIDYNQLFQESTTKALQYMDLSKVFSYVGFGGNPLVLKDDLYKLWDKMDTKERSQDGYPALMERWFKGQVRSHDILNQTKTYIEYLKEQDPKDKKLSLLWQVAKMTMTPESLVDVLSVDSTTLSQILKARRSGKRVVLEGRIDPETDKLMRKKYSDIYKLFHETKLSYQ